MEQVFRTPSPWKGEGRGEGRGKRPDRFPLTLLVAHKFPICALLAPCQRPTRCNRDASDQKLSQNEAVSCQPGAALRDLCRESLFQDSKALYGVASIRSVKIAASAAWHRRAPTRSSMSGSSRSQACSLEPDKIYPYPSASAAIYGLTAIICNSIRAPTFSAATCTVALAGGSFGKNSR